MLPLVEMPELVQCYALFFGDVFSEEAFVEFQRYVSGLIVSEDKTLESILFCCVLASFICGVTNDYRV